ncbi:MAG: hypothetical protein I8H78_05265 [Flavobacteriales bacterium]|nr:hypothetical protein [Flavobacteriales bacterium]
MMNLFCNANLTQWFDEVRSKHPTSSTQHPSQLRGDAAPAAHSLYF